MPIAADRLDEAEEWMRLLLVPNLPVPLALRAVQTFGGVAEPENRGIYTQSDSSKKSSRNIWSLAVVSVDQRY